MWVISSNQDAPCVRPLKPPKGDEGASTQYNPSFWVRPGKEYTAGRAEAFDLYVTHPKLSRKKICFVLKSTAVKSESTLLQQERDAYTPSYSLTIEAGDQGLLALDDSGSGVEIKAGCQYAIRDGVQINAFADKKRECIMTFRWRPVHIYNRVAKKRELPEIQLAFAPLGVTFSNYVNTFPNPTHTHALFPKFSAEPSATQLIAANCQLWMVHPGWTDALLNVTKPEVVSNGGEDARDVEKSKLELDYERNWPSEPRFFPSVDGRDATAAEKRVWLPEPRRRELFDNTVFVDYSKDPNIPLLVATAGGKVCQPPLNTIHDFVPSVEAFCKETGIAERQLKKYLILPHYGTLLSVQEQNIIKEAKRAVSLDGYVRAAAIFGSIKNVVPLQDISAEFEIQKEEDAGALPAPTPSMPGATADISFPATHPGDVPASAPAQEAAVKRPAPPVPAAEGRPNKKPRKLADRGIVDPFANLFATSATASTSIAEPVEGGNDTHQMSTQASSISSRRAVAVDSQDSQSQSRFSRPDSKYSKLKRRVGQDSASQLTPLPELELPDETDQPPVKKFKSFDPDIESVASQAAARQKEREKQENVKRLLADDDEEVKPSQRKAVEVQREMEEEPSREATQVSSRKKGTLAKDEVKGNKKQPEDTTKASQKETVYLQVKTGRRKIAKADADINEDFNNLRIRKTQAAESHKMGWNERDVFQEEMAEDAGWEAEDKSTFFQVRFVPMVRPKNANTSGNPAVDPRYAGKPNFKAFKPKSSAVGTSHDAVQRRSRPEISLVAQEALGYGLTESYGHEGPRRSGNESDESIEMPMPDLDNLRKGKGRAKAVAPSKATKPGKGKRPIVSDSSEEDELAEQGSSTAREESVPAPRKVRAKESITIDSSSDEGDGKTFKGFSASNRITASKR